MKLRLVVLLIITHVAVGLFGFAVGIYTLPILTAPVSPTNSEVQEMSLQANFSADFVTDLADSDALHWGEGQVSIGNTHISFEGQLAPGPDYKLYLSPEFVETEADFERLKSLMVLVGDVNTFENFVVKLDSAIEPNQYNTVVIWCETFGEFITSAQYR
ncbi:DM13 domain-containing protein [Psychrobium sp. 1_MG-2023]|nr:DM13 domain-containing protein [Psychrobium sp. 1_MG-2023]MDP2560609.1 DM13 domain-containing protein [Psychrobium sp. 1_MG-2023]PKF57638.1 hypothetical protein CW748_06835 [Alteromonadales bacterium alter-6D02]